MTALHSDPVIADHDPTAASTKMPFGNPTIYPISDGSHIAPTATTNLKDTQGISVADSNDNHNYLHHLCCLSMQEIE